LLLKQCARSRSANGLFQKVKLMVSLEVVTPVKTGVQRLCNCFNILDSGFRRNDEKRSFSTFYELVKVSG